MLQLIIGILVISIAASTGLIMVQQMGLTVAAQDQRENVRRIDAAALAIEAALGDPDESGVRYAPMANVQEAYSRLPAGLQVIKSTVNGTPFHYCPYAPARSGVGSPAAVNMPNNSTYRVEVNGSGMVVASDASPISDPEFRPAAIIIAAGRNATVPPSCSAVRIEGGKVVVEGGIARVVSAAAISSDARSTVVVSNDAGINAALSAWTRQPPASMRIVLRSSVQVDAGVWARFTQQYAVKPSSFSISASGPATLSVSGGNLIVQGSLEFANVLLSGGHVSIANGGEVVMSGASGVVSSASSAIEVANGGRLSLEGAGSSMRIVSATDGIVSHGQVSIADATIRSGGSGALLGLLMQSRTAIRNSSLGTADSRPGTMAIASIRMAELVTDGASAAFAGPSGTCWGSDASDYSFRYSGNGVGTNSVVGPDEDLQPGPLDDPGLEQQRQDENTARQVRNNERRLARISNRSTLTCR